jgi:ubiquinone/menaquinone biosynthesis C-methylase UbiE
MTVINTRKAAVQWKIQEWSDIEPGEVERLIADTEAGGWRRAITSLEARYPFFAKRLADVALGNWHLLLWPRRHGTALDIGCGYGTLAWGLGEYFSRVLGVDILREKLQFATLRARQERQASTSFAQVNALALSLPDDSFDLVTMKGFLEWTALNVQGRPEVLQKRMLLEAKRVLKNEGVLAVAIENRYAAETLLGLRDTHTGVHLIPALPRPLAKLACYAAGRESYRSYLYSSAGYRNLLRAAGFESTQVLDLVSSYNDYDYVLKTNDALSYRFLYRNGYVRGFYEPANVARRFMARLYPQSLGLFSYAYLVVAGRETRTVLDSSHPIWLRIGKWELTPGVARFACNGKAGGTIAVVTHDGRRCTGLVEFGINVPTGAVAPSVLSEVHRERFAANATLVGESIIDTITVRAFRS